MPVFRQTGVNCSSGIVISDDAEVMKAQVASSCGELLTKACSHTDFVNALLRMKTAVGPEAVYALSRLFKRAEKTVKVHICALWNEVRPCARVAHHHRESLSNVSKNFLLVGFATLSRSARMRASTHRPKASHAGKMICSTGNRCRCPHLASRMVSARLPRRSSPRWTGVNVQACRLPASRSPLSGFHPHVTAWLKAALSAATGSLSRAGTCWWSSRSGKGPDGLQPAPARCLLQLRLPTLPWTSPECMHDNRWRHRGW
jgi:hypothetical protein